MRLPNIDLIASALVGVAVVLYMMWLADKTLPGMSDTRVTGAVILGLGFAASAVAVVPGFEELLRGSKSYLAVTSVLGLVALVGGVWMLWSSSGAGLAVMMATMVVLWAISTTHHWMLATSRPEQADLTPEPQPGSGPRHSRTTTRSG
ncbi:MAG: hypothetical protein ACRDO2_10580 [Nocardioidaceae bacterium]